MLRQPFLIRCDVFGVRFRQLLKNEVPRQEPTNMNQEFGLDTLDCLGCSRKVRVTVANHKTRGKWFACWTGENMRVRRARMRKTN